MGGVQIHRWGPLQCRRMQEAAQSSFHFDAAATAANHKNIRVGFVFGSIRWNILIVLTLEIDIFVKFRQQIFLF